jgi:hypothetical protein
MANCSIPSSTPANGRILTRSSRRSKNSNSVSRLVSGHAALRFFNAQRSTLNAQPVIQLVGCWTLDLERRAFSFARRVKGAWWPSRSSKPSSSRLAGRGRFDSYPLRHLILRFSIANCRFVQTRWARGSIANRKLEIANCGRR